MLWVVGKQGPIYCTHNTGLTVHDGYKTTGTHVCRVLSLFGPVEYD